MTARVRFVDSIDASPSVRLDVNSGPWTTQRESRFDPPLAKRSRVSTLLTDGATYPASAYDERVLELRLVLRAASSDAAATELQKLARELDRPGGNFLEYRLNSQSASVFFRTIRLAMETVDVLVNGPEQLVYARVLAEPFGYGLPETLVDGVTVSADPAAGSNGCFVDVTGVKGDVEAPALIEFPVSGAFTGRSTVFAVRRRGAPSAAPFLFQAEAMSQGTNTTTQANDSDFSGAGNNFSRCTFGTASMADRLSLGDLGTASVDLRGQYRVYLRYRKNTSGDGVNVRIRWGDGNALIANDSVALPNTTALRLIDLGLISIPHGRDPVYDHAGVELVADDDFVLILQAERTSGSGTLDLDYLLLVPVDDRFGSIAWVSTSPTADTYWLDANDNSVHARNAAGQVTSAAAPRGPAGGFPMLSPAQTNRIYMFHVATSGSHLISGTDDVSVSYLPRYLSVRPAST